MVFAFFLLIPIGAFSTSTSEKNELTYNKIERNTVDVIRGGINPERTEFYQPEINKDLFFIESESVHVVNAIVDDPKIPVIDITVNGFNPFLIPNRSDAATTFQNYLIVTIDRDYMDSKLSDGSDIGFTTFLDGVKISHEETSRFPPDRTLKFKIPLGYGQHLEIKGTEIFKNPTVKTNDEKMISSITENSIGKKEDNAIEKVKQSTPLENENILSVKNSKKQSCLLFWCWDIESKQESKDNSFSSTVGQFVDIITPKPYNLYSYSINPIPNIPDKSIPVDALRNAISIWEKNNPDIEFVETNDSPHMTINWKIHGTQTHQGLASCTYYENGDIRDCVLDISLGDNDCNGKYVQQDVNNISNTIMHEMGHSFGLGHTNNENQLMFGDDGVYQMDTLGYNIPDQLDENYVGQKSLNNKHDSLQSKISQLEFEYDRIYSQYSRYEGKTLPANEYQKSMTLYNELNRINSKLSPLISENNILVEKMNCFPNIEQ